MSNAVEARREELGRVPLFECLDPADFTFVLSRAGICTLAEGEVLFRHGQSARRHFYVIAGEIKAFRAAPDGGEKVIEIFHPGTLFAESVMFSGPEPTYPVNAAAVRNSELVAFDNATLMNVLEHSREACFRMMGSMMKRLRLFVDEIDQLTLHSATHRFVYYLFQQKSEGFQQNSEGFQQKSEGAGGVREIVLSTPKHVIAAKLGIQPETFSRIESKLVKGNLIEIHGNHVTLRDVQALRALVEL